MEDAGVQAGEHHGWWRGGCFEERDIPNVTVVHHGRLPVADDGIHFNAEGQIKLGKMTASAVEDFYKESR